MIVAVREDDRSDLTVSTFAPEGADRLASDDPSVVAIAALAYEATDHVALSGAELAPVLGPVDHGAEAGDALALRAAPPDAVGSPGRLDDAAAPR